MKRKSFISVVKNATALLLAVLLFSSPLTVFAYDPHDQSPPDYVDYDYDDIYIDKENEYEKDYDEENNDYNYEEDYTYDYEKEYDERENVYNNNPDYTLAQTHSASCGVGVCWGWGQHPLCQCTLCVCFVLQGVGSEEFDVFIYGAGDFHVTAGQNALVVGDITGNILIEGGLVYYVFDPGTPWEWVGTWYEYGQLLLLDDFTINGTVTVNEGGRFGMTNGKITGSQGRGLELFGHSYAFVFGGLIEGNHAPAGQDGGGIFVDRYASLMICQGATIQNNTARNGGGIFNDGSIAIGEANIINNIATQSGGGIFQNFQIMQSHFEVMFGQDHWGDIEPAVPVVLNITGNRAVSGGGMYLGAHAYTYLSWWAGALPCCGSQGFRHHVNIQDNNARYGGGIFVEPAGWLTVNLTAEIHENTATYGGGVFLDGGSRFFLTPDSKYGIHNNRATYGGGIFMRDAFFQTLPDD